MTSALTRRLVKLEAQRHKDARPSTAFVIWERSRLAGEASLDRALAAGAVKRGDPVVLGVWAGPAPLPASRWTDTLSMPDDELEALGKLPGRPLDQRDLHSMSDAELSSALLESVGRQA